jgi:phosphatidylglycerophosphatase A
MMEFPSTAAMPEDEPLLLPTARTTSPISPPATAEEKPRLRPTAGFMLSHPAHAIALGFGSGLSPFAPGTAGTLWGWLAFLVMQRWFTSAEIGIVIAAALPIGWWACTVTAQRMGQLDPSNIVWDEIVAFWIVLWVLLPAGLWAQIIAFALFRFFDAVKPGPVGWADRSFHGFGPRGGFGIMLDDLVAAFCALLVMAAWRFWFVLP